MFDHILVPLDGSSLAECVLPHVVAIARAMKAKVTLLQVLERAQGQKQGRPAPTQFVDPLGWYMGAAEARTYLDNLAARLQKADLQVETVFLEGQAAERIIEFARDQSVGLIILSSHGRRRARSFRDYGRYPGPDHGPQSGDRVRPPRDGADGIHHAGGPDARGGAGVGPPLSEVE